MSQRLPIQAGAYYVERIASAYLVIDTAGGDERCVARLPFGDDEERKQVLVAAIKTALQLNETRAAMAKEARS